MLKFCTCSVLLSVAILACQGNEWPRMAISGSPGYVQPRIDSALKKKQDSLYAVAVDPLINLTAEVEM